MVVPASPPALITRRIDAGSPDALILLRGLLDEAERADGTPPVSDQAVLAAGQGRRALFAFTSDTPADAGGPSGISDPGAASGAPSAAADPLAIGILGEGELDLVVRPRARGRGIGRVALTELIRVADDEHAGAIRAWAHGENPSAEALLSRAGFAPIRALHRLALDPALLPGAIAQARALPDGFRLQSFAEATADRIDDWVRVNAAAFAEHPEQGAVTADDFRALTREAWFDPEDLILAIDQRDAVGDLLAGYTWIKTVRGDGEPPSVETELYVLGVDPAYAGRGLGAALLGETLRRMAVHHPERITLYVDGDNENARALYERAGFTTEQRSTQWLRAGAAGAAPLASTNGR